MTATFVFCAHPPKNRACAEQSIRHHKSEAGLHQKPVTVKHRLGGIMLRAKHYRSILSFALSLCAGLPLAAQDAAMTSGVSYSSRYGALASVGFEIEDILGGDNRIHLEYRGGEDGQELRGDLRFSNDLGQVGARSVPMRLDLGLNIAASDWDSNDYANVRARTRAGLRFDLSDTVTLSTAALLKFDDIRRVGPKASPLLVKERGRSTSSGVNLGLSFSNMDREALFGTGNKLKAEYTAMPFGDRRYHGLRLQAKSALSTSDTSVLIFRAGVGVQKGLNGQTVSILDRTFLGDRIGPRGFAYGNVGPKDHTASGIDTALGGTKHVYLSGESVSQLSSTLALGVFWDAGSAWDLEKPQRGASGVIDDGFYMRSSLGTSLYWNTQLGTLRFTLATPVRKRSTDTDNLASIGLLASF